MARIQDIPLTNMIISLAQILLAFSCILLFLSWLLSGIGEGVMNPNYLLGSIISLGFAGVISALESINIAVRNINEKD